MELQLCLDDAVLVCTSNSDDNHHDDSSEKVQIGLIKYIGDIDGYGMGQYVGIELVESNDNGHNGIINGVKYFDCPQGHGIHTNITNVIQKLKVSEITMKMQQIITIFKSRLKQYVQALSERDEYIEELKNKQRELRRLLNESQIYQQNRASFGMSPNKLSLNLSSSNPITPRSSSFDAPLRLSAVQKMSNSSNASVLLQNVNKKSVLFKVDKDDNASNNVSIIFKPHSNNKKHRESTKSKTKWSDIKEADRSDDDDDDDDGDDHNNINDDDEVRDEYDDDESSVDRDNNNIISPYSVSTKQRSPVSPLRISKTKSFHHNNNYKKNRDNKLIKMDKSQSYSPSNKYVPSYIPPLNTSISHDMGYLPPQQPYIHNNMSYQQSMNENKRINMNQMKVLIPSQQPTYSNHYNQSVPTLQHNIAPNTGICAASNPVMVPTHQIPQNQMMSLQYPPQQNVIHINHQQQQPPPQQQRFVILYPMPNNNQYDAAMHTPNNSYYHWMQQRQQQ